MDFTKFVSLLDQSSLFFCRADRFLDPFEGTYTQANSERRTQHYQDLNLSHEESKWYLEYQQSFTKWAREWTYISCWHANQYESAAMWNLYAKTEEAVAIETTYEKLAEVLPDNSFLGIVQYIDYQTQWLPEGNTFHPFLHKRRSFEHEREVRAVIQDLPLGDINTTDIKLNDKLGYSAPLELNSLITTVHVSPTAPAWFTKLVTNIIAKYGLKCAVNKSNLYVSPIN